MKLSTSIGLSNGTPPSGAAAPLTNTGSTNYDGVDDYIQCGTGLGNNLGDNYTGDITFSCWFKSNASGAYDDGIIGIGSVISTSIGDFMVRLRNGKIQFYLNVAWYREITFTNDSAWHNLICVYKSGSATNSKIWLDGVETTGSAFGSFPATSAMDFNGLTTLIGTYKNPAFSHDYDGLLDEVAVWNNDQSANVSDIYNSGTAGDLAALSPFAWYRFETGSGTTAIDSGSGGNNGTLTNGVAWSTVVPE